jgi:hypothetical protein
MPTPTEIENKLRNMAATFKSYAAEIDAMLADKPARKKSESKMRMEKVVDDRRKTRYLIK